MLDSVVIVPKSRMCHPIGALWSLSVNYDNTTGGTVSLNPADPRGAPLVDYGFYTAPQDIEVMRQAIRAALAFVSTPDWENFLGAPATATFAAVIDAIQNDQDDVNTVIDAYIRESTTVGFHVVGSCSVSPKGSGWGVVDPDFSVKGVAGLRIVDSSIMVSIRSIMSSGYHWDADRRTLQPFVPAAHTQAAVYAVAERAADIIKRSASLGQ